MRKSKRFYWLFLFMRFSFAVQSVQQCKVGNLLSRLRDFKYEDLLKIVIIFFKQQNEFLF